VVGGGEAQAIVEGKRRRLRRKMQGGGNHAGGEQRCFHGDFFSGHAESFAQAGRAGREFSE
jgi:hypothetical protein